jgi:hypothetical protein
MSLIFNYLLEQAIKHRSYNVQLIFKLQCEQSVILISNEQLSKEEIYLGLV